MAAAKTADRTATDANVPWRPAAGNVTLCVRTTPKGGRDAVDGVTETPDGPALKVRVRAAPEDGEANEALLRLIAGVSGVPRRDVTLTAGHKSRVKSLSIVGDVAAIIERLKARVAESVTPSPQ